MSDVHDEVLALGRFQRETAREFPPGEYVVMSGRQVLAHTLNRVAAFSAYDAAERDGQVPVIIPPDARHTPTPAVFRGRSLARCTGRDGR